jgi:hypothetical protein
MRPPQLALPAPDVEKQTTQLDMTDVQDDWADGLSLTQQKFVLAYVGECKGNMTRAAEKAGLSPYRQNGSRMLTSAVVKRAIQRFVAPLVPPSEMFLSELVEVAFLNTADIIGLTRETQTREGDKTIIRYDIDVDEINRRGYGRFIKSITPTKHGYSIQFHDKLKAIELLGKFRGLWMDKQVNLNFNIEDATPEQLQAIASGRDPSKV